MMDHQGMQVYIEECELADYPALSNWFREEEHNGHFGEPLKDWKLVSQMVKIGSFAILYLCFYVECAEGTIPYLI